MSLTVRSFAARFRSALAAASAAAGIAAGILGGWLTGHWLWGPFCALLALTAIVAANEAIKARCEAAGESSPSDTSSVSGGPYTAADRSRDTYHFSGNASAGNVTIAGGNINDHRIAATVYHNHTTT